MLIKIEKRACLSVKREVRVSEEGIPLVVFSQELGFSSLCDRNMGAVQHNNCAATPLLVKFDISQVYNM